MSDRSCGGDRGVLLASVADCQTFLVGFSPSSQRSSSSLPLKLDFALHFAGAYTHLLCWGVDMIHCMECSHLPMCRGRRIQICMVSFFLHAGESHFVLVRGIHSNLRTIVGQTANALRLTSFFESNMVGSACLEST